MLDELASELNLILPRMGEGFWAEFKANTSSAMEEFTTGYSGDIRELANRWLGYNEASMDYGNDYVAAGNKFVAAVQQAQVDYARQAAVQATQVARYVAKVFDSTEGPCSEGSPKCFRTRSMISSTTRSRCRTS